MKSFYLYLLAFFIALPGMAQRKSSVKWGQDFKLKKGSIDLKVIDSDKSGIYLQEEHLAMKSYYVFGASFRSSGTLVKMNANLSEIYRHSYNKDLRGKEFEQFFPCAGDLFIIASAYHKGDKMLELFAAKVDKATGELSVRWKQIASFQQERKNDKVRFKLAYNADSTKMMLVSSIQGKERNEYKIQEFDSKLKASKPIVISNEFEAKKYELEDVLYTVNNKVVLVGRVYEYEEGKKKKDKFLDFSHYNIRVYDATGKQQTEINTSVNGRWLSSTKVLQEKNEDLVLAAFYSNEKKARRVDGLLVQRIDINTGKVISTNDKAINAAMLSDGNNEDDDDKEDDKQDKGDKVARKGGKAKTEKNGKAAKEGTKESKEEAEGFSRYMKFRNIFYTSDGGLMILAEAFHSYIYTTSYYSPGVNGAPGTMKTTTYQVFQSDDLLMCKIAASGNIDWMHVLPKSQTEHYAAGSSSGRGTGLSLTTSYFSLLNYPYYSGFGALHSGHNLSIVLNDNPKNMDITAAGQKFKSVRAFGRSECFLVSVDDVTGKITRKVLFNNRDIPTAMPGKGVVIGNDLYLVGRSDRAFGKTRIAAGKISVK
ncbi:hypothetical protein [Chitinophaga rhizophila]|uniref:Uncharacterized protein n=1 Tax=Chitinophaga rhizophila TaxID=2866212 RepID=A0ABS7GCW7_9BACT|nr:hypothetical protein [Chitinophaga rhizophila]MBW8685266.1 hypothetical protein [Chitinophaga rhizophila]